MTEGTGNAIPKTNIPYDYDTVKEKSSKKVPF
jgi:hypothetical protein